jgi:HAMP domain-containing protein
VTRPLRRLTRAVSTLSQRGLAEGLAVAPSTPLPPPGKDEFGQLTTAFEMLLDVCRRQWNALRRSDHYRREGVSNLSHDLRSPLTATVACLETLDGRWTGEPGREEERRLVEIALRNTRNAARMVQSLGRPGQARRAGVRPAPGRGRRERAARRHRPALRRARGPAGGSPAPGIRVPTAPASMRTTAAACVRGSTSSCSSAPSPTCSTTPSSSARRGARSWSAPRCIGAGSR